MLRWKFSYRARIVRKYQMISALNKLQFVRECDNTKQMPVHSTQKINYMQWHDTVEHTYNGIPVRRMPTLRMTSTFMMANFFNYVSLLYWTWICSNISNENVFLFELHILKTNNGISLSFWIFYANKDVHRNAMFTWIAVVHKLEAVTNTFSIFLKWKFPAAFGCSTKKCYQQLIKFHVF